MPCRAWRESQPRNAKSETHLVIKWDKYKMKKPTANSIHIEYIEKDLQYLSDTEEDESVSGQLTQSRDARATSEGKTQEQLALAIDGDSVTNDEWLLRLEDGGPIFHV
jgi:hypothetical protein